jgi:hypothetical protein
MLGGGGMAGAMKAMKGARPTPQQLQQMQQAARHGGGGFQAPGGKKRKKGGPWGLIKTR